MPGHRRRQLRLWLFRIGTGLALLLVLAPSVWLIEGVVARAAPHWKWSVLWSKLVTNTGGLEGPLIGTLILMAGVLIVAGSVGVLAGIHLAELARPRRNGAPGGGALRLASDVLSGFPSIVLGYVAYVSLVVGLHWGFGLLPAVLVLSVMVVPYIAKATETSLRQVATGYREGAEALGMSTGYALRKVVLRSAAPGIVTGLLIALAISCGETAPLIYTAQFAPGLWTGSLIHTHGFGYLTYVVFTFYNTSTAQANYLSYDAAVILIAIVLLLLVSARILVARTQRYSEARGR
jgi:phosphate transport system permease protein